MINDETYEKHKARVRGFLDAWREPLGVDQWRIRLEWYREPIPGANEKAVMTCTAEWRYLEAHLEISLTNVDKHMQDDDELEECVVHELCHMLVSEMQPQWSGYIEPKELETNLALPHEERVCTILARAFLRVRGQHGNAG